MVILLTLKESENQVISGIPEYVEFETNVPATVFYTFDGEEPTLESEMATGRVFLPVDGTSLTLKAVAISGAFSSSVLEENYFTDQLDLDRARLLGKEGVNILPSGATPVASLTVNADGDPVQSSKIPISDLDIVTSEVNRIGETIPDGSSKDFIKFPQTISKDNSFKSTNVNSVNFDPAAKVIIIDGSSQEARDEQVVRIINRPQGTLNPVSNFYNPQLEQQPLVSGSLVRPMYNPQTGKAVFYYMESRENRWIKSIQETDYKAVDISPRQSTFVFRWIEERGMSKLLL